MLAAAPAVAMEPAADCVAAAQRAEQAFDLPAGLLRAIGEVESGLRDRGTGQLAPWPWTVDEAGVGQFFPSADMAIAYVSGRLSAGVRNIDVGCFQISLLNHPEAFSSLEQAFDPQANAEAAARLLVELRARAESWEAAAGLYHSATPWRAAAYRDLVMRRWTGSPAEDSVPMPIRAYPVGGMIVRVILPAWAVHDSMRPHSALHSDSAARLPLAGPLLGRRRGLPVVQTPSQPVRS